MWIQTGPLDALPSPASARFLRSWGDLINGRTSCLPDEPPGPEETLCWHSQRDRAPEGQDTGEIWHLLQRAPVRWGTWGLKAVLRPLVPGRGQ